MWYTQEEAAKAKLREEIGEFLLSVGIMCAAVAMWTGLALLGWHLYQLASK